MNDLIAFLRPLKDSTVDLEADNHPTLHCVVYNYKKIEQLLVYKPHDSNLLIEIKTQGRLNIYLQWVKRIQRVHHAALLLYPREKNSPAVSIADLETGNNFIKEMMQLFNQDIASEPV